MGRYIRKSKQVGEVVLMEVAQFSSSLGVCTRAKTLALQRRQELSATAVKAATGMEDGSPVTGGSYLQLRNRRLKKPPIPAVNSKRRRHYVSKSNPSSNFIRPRDSGSSKSGYGRIAEQNSRSEKVEEFRLEKGETEAEAKEEIEGKENGDLSIEASFGENVLDIDAKERGVRESTPISLIRDPQKVTTPGSSTRPQRKRPPSATGSKTVQLFPTSEELDLFFCESEQLQERQFKDKYNFDPAKDEPLPGRFKWVKPDQ